MITELIAITILIISFIGASAILLRKAPILAELPSQDVSAKQVFGQLKEGIKKHGSLKQVSMEKFLHRVLQSTEKQANSWSAKLKQRDAEKKKSFSSSYWQALRKKGDSQEDSETVETKTD